MKTLTQVETAEIRQKFPVMKACTYLDLGGRAPLSTDVLAAVTRHLDDCVQGRVDKDAWFRQAEAVRNRYAALINAQPDEVAYTKNTSEGLNIVCAGIDWQSGDNVVLCPELEHPNNIYLWLNLRRRGVEVRLVKPRDGAMPIDELIAAMDERTRLLTVSSVSFIPGFRTDVERLGRACRARGALFLVDGAQSVGVLHTDVEAMCIDALAVSTQKGLMAMYGMGFLYVRRAVAEQLDPAYVARFGIDISKADAHESDFGGTEFSFLPGARRFDLGNYNFAGVCAAEASLALIASIGTKRIEEHVTALAHALGRGLIELGLPVCGGAPGPHIAQTISVGHYEAGAASPGSADTLRRLHRHLLEQGVKLSVRRDMLRFSMHVYNGMEDIDRVLALCKGFLRREKTRAA
ncbi:MAG: aminotransferase class V-fold PLP-dependent enzyme [Alcaligenaceae bacterium]|nr:aminotransferase class V-fold PLP-dependent enzyme [Alcaligenaceae bacterium]